MRQLLAALMLMLAGCATAALPKHAAMDIPPAWQAPLGPGIALSASKETAWWQALGDPVLTSLMERAFEQNLDLKSAISRVREARARAAMAGASAYPSLDASAQAALSGNSSSMRDSYSAGIDAAWELDFFGANSNTAQAALASAQGTEHSYHAASVSLAAEVAINYIDLRSTQQQAAITREQVTSSEQSLDMVQSLVMAGIRSELDRHEARLSLSSLRAQLPSLDAQARQTINALSILLALPPGALAEELSRSAALPQAPLNIALAIPAEALANRPDLMAAQRQYAAQTARAGAARAELYPRVRLTGSVGLEALSLGSLLPISRSNSLGLGLGISWPLFDAGAARANVVVQDEMLQQARYEYESAVLAALSEVEGALLSYQAEHERMLHLADALKDAQMALELNQQLYSSGSQDYQSVVQSRQQLHSTKENMVRSKAGSLSALVRLYKAIGGGWQQLPTINQRGQDGQ